MTRLRDYAPALPLTFAKFHVRAGSTCLVFAEGSESAKIALSKLAHK